MSNQFSLLNPYPPLNESISVIVEKVREWKNMFSKDKVKVNSMINDYYINLYTNVEILEALDNNDFIEYGQNPKKIYWHHRRNQN